ncbi:MAG: L-threonylcarbamoyladenylate synthase [Saprospiraceae bacterium]
MNNAFRDNIRYVAERLSVGDVILCPTDTIWGLSCDSSNEEAVRKLKEIKQLPDDRPLVILTSSLEMAKAYTLEIHPRIQTILEFYTRPLTLIHPHGKGVANGIMNEADEIAIRICSDPFCQALIEELGRPIVTTSANLHGSQFPASFKDIDPVIKKAVDYIVMHRQLETREYEPSIIARLGDNEELDIIRN